MKTFITRLLAAALLVQVVYATPLYAHTSWSFTGTGTNFVFANLQDEVATALQQNLNSAGDLFCSIGGKCKHEQDTLPQNVLAFFDDRSILRGNIAAISIDWASNRASQGIEVANRQHCSKLLNFPVSKLTSNLLPSLYGAFKSEQEQLSRHSQARISFLLAVAKDPADAKKVLVFSCLGGLHND